jgi:DNA-binding NarL/FixJ family response regulator
MEKVSVVFVRDPKSKRNGLKERFIEDGIFRVSEAFCVKDAYSMAREYPVDIILLDNLLPDDNGFNVCEQLMNSLKTTKVIVLSAQNDFSAVQEALAEGCVGFLPKNATFKEIRDAVLTVHQGGHYLHPKSATELAKGLQDKKKRSEEVSLNEEELQVLKLVANGLSYSEIASQVFISERTVRRRVQTIFDKLGVNSKAHAVAEAMRREYLD